MRGWEKSVVLKMEQGLDIQKLPGVAVKTTMIAEFAVTNINGEVRR